MGVVLGPLEAIHVHLRERIALSNLTSLAFGHNSPCLKRQHKRIVCSLEHPCLASMLAKLRKLRVDRLTVDPDFSDLIPNLLADLCFYTKIAAVNSLS